VNSPLSALYDLITKNTKVTKDPSDYCFNLVLFVTFVAKMFS